jgi:ribosomal protein L20
MTMALLAKSKTITDTKNGIRIAENALLLCEELQDPSRYKSFVYSTLVHLRFMNSNMELAQKAVDGAIWYAYLTTDRRIKGIAWFRKGWIQDIQGEAHEAEANYLQALNYLEGTKAYSYESFVYYYLAGNYGSWNDLPNQQKYAQLCLQTARQSGDPENLAFAYQGMASYYLNDHFHRLSL